MILSDLYIPDALNLNISATQFHLYRSSSQYLRASARKSCTSRMFIRNINTFSAELSFRAASLVASSIIALKWRLHTSAESCAARVICTSESMLAVSRFADNVKRCTIAEDRSNAVLVRSQADGILVVSLWGKSTIPEKNWGKHTITCVGST